MTIKQIRAAQHWSKLDFTQELTHKFQTLHDWCKIVSINIENSAHAAPNTKQFEFVVSTKANGFSFSNILMVSFQNFNKCSNWNFLCNEAGKFRLCIEDAELNNIVDNLLINKGYMVK